MAEDIRIKKLFILTVIVRWNKRIKNRMKKIISWDVDRD